MSSTRQCPGCLAESTRSNGSVNGYRLVRCSRCATLFTACLPTEEDATDYQGSQAVSLDVPGFVERRLEEIAAGFASSRSLNRWLDVGCGAGALIRAASRLGWDAVGTEVSPGAAEAIAAAGLEVHLGTLDTLAFDPGSFDVVSMVEVVEHLDDPEDTLRRAVRLVRPRGKLYLTTPNGHGLSARLLGTDWSVVAPPEHLQLFSVKGMRALIGRSGLDRVAIRTHALNPHELRSGVLRRPPASASSRKATGRQLNESLTSTRRGVLAKNAINAALNAARAGDTLKVIATRQA